MQQLGHKRISELSVIEFFNTFSVLVVLGSLSTSYFFGRFFHAELPLVFYWLLPSTVWLIYTVDHILDGIKLKSQASSVRHQIHFEYRKLLLVLCCIIALINATLSVFRLPDGLMNAGVTLALFVLIYLFIVHNGLIKKYKWLKEVFISIGVSFGMAVLPGLEGDLEWDLSTSVLVLAFTALNFSNLLIFSYFDHERDVRDGFDSSSVHLSQKIVEKIIHYSLATTFLLIGIWTFLFSSINKLPTAMSFLVMINILGAIMLLKEEFADNGRYRFWGDIIYLVPGVLWLLLFERPFM